MGIFSDRCEALVDKATGKALTGRALEDARQVADWPRCGNSVKKSARGCNECGAPAPGGWARCTKCGKWVGNDSRFCWNCRTALHPEDQGTMSDGHWQKPPGTFARRLDVGDIKALLHRNRIFVGEGTTALLLQGGKYKDALGPGTHTLDSLATRINHWGDPPPESVVLVDAADNAFPVRIEDLRSSEDVAVELYVEVHVRLVGTDAANRAFLANLMKDARELVYDEVAGRFRSELRYAALNLCNATSVDDLFKDPERRIRLEDELQRVAKRTEETYGLAVVRISSVEVTGKAYEALRAKSGEVEAKRREAEYDLRMRELTQKDRMHEFKTQYDLAEYEAQLAHEKDISHARRKNAAELLGLGQELHLSTLREEHRRAQAIADAKTDVERRRIEDEGEVESTRKWAEVAQQEEERIQRTQDREAERRIEVLKKTAALFEGTKPETLLALVEDAARRKDLLELYRLRAAEGRSADEILAMAACQSPAVAEALIRRAGIEKQEFEKLMEERRAMFREMREHDERVFDKAASTAAEAARHPGTSNIVNK